MPHRPNRRDRRPKDFDGAESARLLYGGASTTDTDSDSDTDADGEDGTDRGQCSLFD
jgi:hypothetical protein